MSRLNRARSILTAAVAVTAMAIGTMTPATAFAAESAPVLAGLTRVSPDVVVSGDEVVFAFEFDAPVRRVEVQLLDSLGGSRYVWWSGSEPAASGEARAPVDTSAWPGGEVTFTGMSYSWGDQFSSVGLDASGNVTWKSPGLPDVTPVGDVMDVAPFEVNSDVDLSVPPSLSGVSLASDAVVVDGDAVEVAWTSDVPVQRVSFSFIDGVGRWHGVDWYSWQNGGQPATSGVAGAVVDTASWAGGASLLDGISYSWAAGSMTLSLTGAVESKYPPGVKNPMQLEVDPDALTFTVESDVDLTPVASLVSVDRVSPDVVADGAEVQFAWETDSPVTSVGFAFLDGFGREHSLSWWNQTPTTSGVTSTVVDASGWAPGVSKVIQVQLTFPNGSVNLSRDGSLSSKWPAGIDDPTPWPDGFGSLDFMVESDVVFHAVPVPEPVFEDATCDSPAHLKLDDFDHGRWSWSPTDGRSGEGDESFDGVPWGVRDGTPYVVTAFFDDGWGTDGESRWSHVYVDPGTCEDQPLTSAPKPILSGDPVVGSTLTVDPGSWEPAPVDLSYRWLRNGVAIEGAGSTSYVLTAADVDTAITVEVTGTKSGYLPATTISDPVTVTAAPNSTVTRLSGADRFAAAVAISEENFASGVDVVYVANGLNFPDALAAAPVAGIQGGPVLLVTPGSIPAVVQDELDRLEPGRIVVVGGVNSVGSDVYEALAAYTG